MNILYCTAPSGCHDEPWYTEFAKHVFSHDDIMTWKCFLHYRWFPSQKTKMENFDASLFLAWEGNLANSQVVSDVRCCHDTHMTSHQCIISRIINPAVMMSSSTQGLPGMSPHKLPIVMNNVGQYSLAPHIHGLVQERCNSIANTLELHLSCTNPWHHISMGKCKKDVTPVR